MGESENDGAIFAGVSFLLAGFEPESEIQLAGAIEQNGGVNIRTYDAACTHVIVSRSLLYDDPVCAAARKDRKSIVTELWVADCLDLGVATDVNSVIYKPVRNLEGVPGSRTLVICLTGYQGQARRDVMRMVQMMGAAFTKPLIANRVTHLVCYKFEGEKYFLAKQLGLKLVNHRWLEDCLKQWSVLSEDNYFKSGLEEELLEAEAKDSEEEDGIIKIPSTLSGVSAGMGAACYEIVNEKDKMSPSAHCPLNAEANLPDKASVVKPKHAVTQINRSRISEGHEAEKVITKANIDAEPGWLEPADVDESTSLLHVNVDIVEENRSETDTAVLNSYKVEGKNASCNPCEQIDCENFENCLVKEELLADPTTMDSRKKESEKHHGENRRHSGRKVLRKVSEVDIIKNHDVGILEHGDALQGEEITPELHLVTSNFLEVGKKRMSINNQEAEPLLEIPSIRSPQNSLNKNHGSQDGNDKQATVERNNSEVDCRDEMGARDEAISQVQVKKADEDIQGKKHKGRLKGSRKQGKGPNKLVSSEDKAKDVGVESMVDERASDKENAAVVQECKGRQRGSKKRGKSSTKLVSPEDKAKDVGIESMIDERACSDKENSAGIQECDGRTLLGTPLAFVDDAVLSKKAVEVNSCQNNAVQKRLNDMWFAISGERQEKKSLQIIVKRLGGRLCRDFHRWSHQTSHLVVAGPLRRTEKFFAAAAAGRWILKEDYLKASNESSVFQNEEEYEWHGSQMNEDGSISFEAPRKWRKFRETTGRCALEGLRILVYGECIIPSLDTLKRAIQAGGGTVLATSPPYTRSLASRVDFVIVNAEIPKEDYWIEEFLSRGAACVTADFFVDFVCKPTSPLERHILYNTNSAVQEVLGRLQSGIQNASDELAMKNWKHGKGAIVEKRNDPNYEIGCSKCGKTDRDDVMLLCGDEKGGGCGIAMHIDCCKPPLGEVPEEDWFCMQCTKAPARHYRGTKKRKTKSIR